MLDLVMLDERLSRSFKSDSISGWFGVGGDQLDFSLKGWRSLVCDCLTLEKKNWVSILFLKSWIESDGKGCLVRCVGTKERPLLSADMVDWFNGLELRLVMAFLWKIVLNEESKCLVLA